MIKNRFDSNRYPSPYRSNGKIHSMQLIVQYSNLITFGNILAIITGIGSVITAVVLVYWKVKRTWMNQHLLYLADIQRMLDQHTAKIENCIHQIPGHPEQVNNPSPDNSSMLQEES